MIREAWDALAVHFPLYYRVLASFLTVISISGFIAPLQSYRLWTMLTANRGFRLYGLLHIILGFPLLHYTGTIAGNILFGLGLIVVFTGPFVLLFPESFRQVFAETEQSLSDAEKKSMIIIDSVVRIGAAGLITFVSFSHA